MSCSFTDKPRRIKREQEDCYSKKSFVAGNFFFCHFLLRLRLLDLFGLLHDFVFVGAATQSTGICFHSFWTLTLIHHLIASDAVNSSVRTFCSTGQGSPGIYWTIPS